MSKRREVYRLWETRLEERVRKLLARYGGLDADDREDILAEAREQVVDALRVHCVKDAEAYGWTVARNFVRKTVLAVRKSRQSMVPLEGQEPASPDEVRMPGPEEIVHDAIRALAAELPEEECKLLLACFSEGGSVANAARQFGLARTTAASRMAASVVKLRAALRAQAQRDMRLALALQELWGDEVAQRLTSSRMRYRRQPDSRS